jgi:hypothetical protein
MGIAELIWFIVKMVITMAISAGIAYAIAHNKKGPKQRPVGTDEFQFPTAQEVRVPPLVSGTREVFGPNALSGIFDRVTFVRRRYDEKVKFYWYAMGLHWGICNADVDGIVRIDFNRLTAWPTAKDPTDFAADGVTSISITSNAAGSLFGGYYKEGGIRGAIRVQYGGAAQTLDSYLSANLGATQPAYKQFTGVIWERLFVTSTSQIPAMSCMVRRRNKHPDGTAMWYAAKAQITLDGDSDLVHLNAIHFLYERLVCPLYGLGKSSTDLGSSWSGAADTCYTDGYGISNVWDSAPDDIESIVQRVEGIIEGKVYQDPTTGKFEIGLIRNDYDAGTLEQFDEGDFWVEAMASGSPGGLPTQTMVEWFDRATRQARPAYSDDLAIQTRQGGARIINEIDYSAFVCSPALAALIANREQQQIVAMPKRLTLRALRTMAHLHETSVVKISYAALGIVSMIVRVITIDRGSLTEGECVIEVMEDVYGQVYTMYGSPPATGMGTETETPSDWPVDEGVLEAAGSVTSIETGPYGSSSPSASISVSPSASASEGTPSASVSQSPSQSPSQSISSSPSASPSSSPSQSGSSSPSTSPSASASA